MVGADFTRTCEWCEHVVAGAVVERHALLSVLCSRQMQGACRRRETL